MAEGRAERKVSDPNFPTGSCILQRVVWGEKLFPVYPFDGEKYPVKSQ